MIRTTVCAAALALSAVAAFSLELGLPLDCPDDVDCFVQQYVDRDNGPGAVDYTCGTLAYDGHSGTDIRAASFQDLKRGIEIIAATSGVVRAIRNDQPDMGKDGAAKNKECGNGVTLDHGDGWVTHYCHLAQNSIVVAPGEVVETGQKLGLMGFSGLTTFPHLHFTVTQRGEVVDPFDARSADQSCSLEDKDSLWSIAAERELRYRPGGLIDFGLTGAPPTLADIRAGASPNSAKANADALVFWARFFGVRKGDLLSLQLLAPDGSVLAAKQTEMDRNRAIQLRYIGKKGTNWPKGDYRATAALVREGSIIELGEGEYEVR